jgi:transposase
MPNKKRTVSEAKLTDLCRAYTTMCAEGVSRAKAYAAVCQLDYPNTRRSLNRQLCTMAATGHALVVAKRDSRKPFLDASQEEKVVDFVRTKNSQNTACALRDLQVFIRDEFNLSVSASFCSRLVHKLGMSNRKCRTRSSGYKRSPDELVDMYWKFIVHLKKKMLIF